MISDWTIDFTVRTHDQAHEQINSVVCPDYIRAFLHDAVDDLFDPKSDESIHVVSTGRNGATVFMCADIIKTGPTT